ncbi:3-hydroxyacyl-CoA dehydrogenase family protein [Agriterribacter sp.]|uniref:3-hydroxyacyl-CoA dehydrogenase family protein n=1 Tax=Agriterribacter sp. TaxID=2821509 RepID=UPI002C612D07|nr:3-hydroxyacyl-CoA dehydrogenase family protein [Agriterribacter sp.]HRO46535.1 3-hydroxyacyl-CoA dehydrogenase family protein [Agriterribacter sp.]HRQ17536.1 3-hydroxyacyl-CoA dehydrogenase family protein [Agriterribacter sp.]
MTRIKDTNIGIVGVGLMGSSIVASLLVAGHTVKAIAPLAGELDLAAVRIKEQLLLCEKGAFLTAPVDFYLSSLTISEDYNVLHDCSLVVECIIEDMEIKEAVFKKIIASVSKDAVLASNTSAIPITMLQTFIPNPERFIGIHWAEPAFATRFLEIICGDKTSDQTANWVFELAHHWGKEPTLLRKDIRGFITNRLMYSVYREALTLVEHGHATIEDADKAFRYDMGSWITLMGIFRRMDFIGLQDFPVIFNALFPGLSNTGEVPAVVQKLMDKDARGTQNGIGFYSYTEEACRSWDKAFEAFNQDIYRLAALYPAEAISSVLK